MDPLFTLLGADAQTLPAIREYMPLWLLASAILAIPVNGNSAIRATGDFLIPAIVMTSIALINLALDPVMIFGLFGFPALGVKGAALATLIAYAAGLVLGLYFLIFKKKMVSLSLHANQFPDSVRRLAVIAVPAGITNIIMPATNAFIVALLAAYGPEAVAAFGIVTRIEAFALLIIISLALAMAPIVGQNWGAKNYARVHETINLSIGFNFIWSFFVAVLLGAFAKPIAGAFSDDPAVIYFAALFFWIVPFSYAFGNLVFGWGSAFNAMGMPQRAFFMIVMKALILTIPGVYFGGLFFGIHGIFVAIATVNVAAGIYFHLASWRLCLRHEDGTAQPA
jgi:putative MATE family efflux protein